MPRGKQHYLMVVGLGVALVPALALGQGVRAPRPEMPPHATVAVGSGVDMLTLTSAIPLTHPEATILACCTTSYDITALKARARCAGRRRRRRGPQPSRPARG